MLKLKLHWQIMIGILLGLVAGTISGHLFPEKSLDILLERMDFKLYDLGGDLFMQALKMLIVPLIAASIISSMGALNERDGFARLGGKTLLYYICTSAIAILIGLTFVNMLEPGITSGVQQSELVPLAGSQEASKLDLITKRTEGKSTGDFLNVIRELIPKNIVAAAANGKMLGLIVFTLIFGFFVARLEGDNKEKVLGFFTGLNSIMLNMTNLVMKFAPIGIFFLIAETSGEAIGNNTFVERISQLILFALTVTLALGTHAFVVMPLLLSIIGKVNPLKQFKAMGPALLTAFSTASSAATLPMTLECVQERASVSKRVSSFVLPVGATVNMDGTALYECVAVMFLAQIYGVELGFSTQALIVGLALLTSIGVAAVPSASLVAIVIILEAVNKQIGSAIPSNALAIILIFDRVLDMLRTSVNVFSDSCGAVIIARTEGEKEVLAD